jgi:hypothetical protein
MAAPVEAYTLALFGVVLLAHVATSKQHPLICIWETFQPMLSLIVQFVTLVPEALMVLIESLHLPEMLADMRALSAHLHSKL